MVEEEWPQHRKEALVSMQRISEMYNVVDDIQKNTEHLRQLEPIAKELKNLNDNLVGPATGRKQVSLTAHIVTIAILGSALLVLFLDKSQHSLRISTSGIEIIRDEE